MRPLSFITRILLGSLLALAGLGATSAGAATTTTPPVSGALVGFNFSGTWVGSWQLSNGASPVYAENPATGYLTGSYALAGTQPLTADNYAVGYLISHYGTNSGANVQAEVAALVSLHTASANASAAYNLLSAGQKSAAGQLWSVATSAAGPYSVSLRWPASVSRGVAAQAEVVVTTSTGAPAPNMAVALSATNATLTQSTVTTGANGTGLIGFTVPANATGGSMSITAAAAAVAGILKFNPTGSPAGRPAAIGAGTAVRYATTNTTSFALAHQVNLVTYVNAPGVDVAGASFSLMDSQGKTVGTFTTQTTPVSLGNLTEGETYRLVSTATPSGTYAPASAYAIKVATTNQTQQYSVTLRSTPSLSLVVSSDKAPVTGGSAGLGVTVSGNDDETGTLTATLYGPLSAPSCASIAQATWSGAAKSSYSQAIAANGRYHVQSQALSAPGCYSWGAVAMISPSHAGAGLLPGRPGSVFLVKTAVPVTKPTVPVTRPTVPVTRPTVPVTRPTAPATTTTRATTTTTWNLPTTTMAPPAGGGGGSNSTQMILVFIFILLVLLLLIDILRRRRRR